MLKWQKFVALIIAIILLGILTGGFSGLIALFKFYFPLLG